MEILFDHGLLMRGDELERLAVDDRGLNRNSFYSYLGYSPVLERYAPGVWGLRGAPATAAKVDVLIPPRIRRKVLQDHGWTPEGRLWIAYRLSPAAARSGVLGVPAVLQTVLRGQFELIAEDGQPVGTLVAEEHLWGLSPFFRSWRVEAGDMLVISVDLGAREALVEVGDDELLLHCQAAGEAPTSRG